MENSNNKTPNSKQIINPKQYNLEDRSFAFAKRCRDYTKKLPRNISNIEYVKQLIRSSGSVAANYIEANESLSRKDFAMRVKICRKEAKETRLWLNLAEPVTKDIKEKEALMQEITELMKIFGAILEKTKNV